MPSKTSPGLELSDEYVPQELHVALAAIPIS